MAIDSRLHPRIKITCKLASVDTETGVDGFSLGDTKRIKAEVFDLSIGGMGLLLNYFLPKGLQIKLLVDGKCFNSDKEIMLKAEVRYCITLKANRYKCGIRFTDISEENKNIIVNFIASHKKNAS